MKIDEPAHPWSQGVLRSAWGWITAPLRPATSAVARRRRLLAWLLLALLLQTLATVFVLRLGPSPRIQYIPLIFGMDACLVVAYVLNAAGHDTLAAGLAVLTTSIGPWGSLLVDPAILRGDFVPLAYATLSVLLCSILLPPVITAVLAALQFAGYMLIAWSNPASTSLNWLSLLALLFFASVLSILSSIISRDNLAEIDRQTRQLEESEARLRELSVRDHLTQLFNRRYLEETLDREIRRSERAHRTIGLILFDVDQFKQVNDKWGHAAGDLLLQQVGELARQHIRGGDIACRYGGDEFVLVLPEASRYTTRQRAERLRDAISHTQPEYHGQTLGPVTISAGVAMYPRHGSSCEELLKSADKALYSVKEAGRNGIAVAGLENRSAATTHARTDL